MKVGRQARKDSKSLFRACLNDLGTLDQSKVRQVVYLVLKDKPRGYLAILNHFQKLIRLKLAERTAIISTATPLSESESQALVETITAKYGQDMSFEYRDDPTLIGGTRIQIGSDVFDASIKGRLQTLAQSF